MKVAWTAWIVGLGALVLAGCGSASNCSEVCQKAKTCGAVPGALGNDVAACTSACGKAVERSSEAVRACVDFESCEHISLGRCGGW